MKVQELQNEEMYAMFSPEGVIQLMTIAPDSEACFAVVEMFSAYGLTDSFEKLSAEGFLILPIKITLVQNGDEDKPFKNDGKKNKA